MAFVFAHELAHLERGHERERDKLLKDFQNRWLSEFGWLYASVEARDHAYMLSFREVFVPRVDELSRRQEAEADRLAVAYLSAPASRYKAFEGAILMRHLKDQDWVLGADKHPGDATHPALTQRALDVEFWSAVWAAGR